VRENNIDSTHPEEPDKIHGNRKSDRGKEERREKLVIKRACILYLDRDIFSKMRTVNFWNYWTGKPRFTTLRFGRFKSPKKDRNLIFYSLSTEWISENCRGWANLSKKFILKVYFLIKYQVILKLMMQKWNLTLYCDKNMKKMWKIKD